MVRKFAIHRFSMMRRTSETMDLTSTLSVLGAALIRSGAFNVLKTGFLHKRDRTVAQVLKTLGWPWRFRHICRL